MRAQLDRSIVSLKIFHVVIGLLFVVASALYCAAYGDELVGYFLHFTNSLWNALGALTIIFTTAMAVIYLIPTLLGWIIRKYSAELFEFQVFIDRALMYFPLAPGIVLLTVHFCYLVFLKPGDLGPAGHDTASLSAYAFGILLYIIAALMVAAYKLAHKLR